MGDPTVSEHNAPRADLEFGKGPADDRQSNGMRFNLQSLFLITGYLALAGAAIAWRERSMASAVFVAAASTGGIVATLSRSRRVANVLFLVIATWLVVLITISLATLLIG